MTYYLLPYTYAVQVGRDLVVLDIANDAYFCLVEAAALIDLSQAPQVAITSAEMAEALSEAGLVTAAAASRSGSLRRRPPDRPAFDLMDLPPPRPMAGDRRRMSRAYGDMLWRYAGRSLRHLVTSHPRQEDSEIDLRSRPPPQELVRLALRSRQLLPWAPFQGECLFKSFMLLRLLRRSGLDALWVFGVRTWPFEAHCWLQAGDVVLNDTAEHVLGYEPIFSA